MWRHGLEHVSRRTTVWLAARPTTTTTVGAARLLRSGMVAFSSTTTDSGDDKDKLGAVDHNPNTLDDQDASSSSLTSASSAETNTNATPTPTARSSYKPSPQPWTHLHSLGLVVPSPPPTTQTSATTKVPPTPSTTAAAPASPKASSQYKANPLSRRNPLPSWFEKHKIAPPDSLREEDLSSSTLNDDEDDDASGQPSPPLRPSEIARPQKFVDANILLEQVDESNKARESVLKEIDYPKNRNYNMSRYEIDNNSDQEGAASSTTTVRRLKTWGDHLADSGTKVTYEPWIIVTHIPPTSSLEVTLDMIQAAIDEDLLRGVVDLDALFIPRSSSPPMLRITEQDIVDRQDRFPHIMEARLILSPFARPKGWYIRLAHRSLAQSLLVRQRRGFEFVVASRVVSLQPYFPPPQPDMEPFPGSFSHVSDATVRVENCPPGLTKIQFWNFFSRYDLSMDHTSVVQWHGQTPDGKQNSSDTYLVQFADPSWARAAIRERQGDRIRGFEVRLSQYPRQLLS